MSGQRGNQVSWLLLLAAAVLAAYGLRGMFSPAPEVVVPAAGIELEPRVSALVQQHVAAANSDPRDSTLHGRLGLVYLANSLWVEALRSFEHASTLAPQEPYWIFYRALACRQIGDVAGALELHLEAAERMPTSAAAQQRVAEALLEAGDLEGAAQAFRALAVLAPSLPDADVGLGEVSLARQEHEQAAQHFERAIGLDGSYRRAHYGLGNACRSLGRLEEAERELALGQRAGKRFIPDGLSEELDSYRRDLQGAVTSAAALLESGRAAEAIALLEREMAAHPDDLGLLNNLSVAHLRMTQVDRAIELLEHAVSIDSNDFPTRINLGEAMRVAGRLDDALAHADRAVEISTTAAAARATRAHVLVDLDRYEEAIVDLEAAARLEPSNGSHHAVLGSLYLKEGRSQEARERLALSLEIAPSNLAARRLLFEACVATGDLEAAGLELKEIRRQVPGHPVLAELETLLKEARQ